MSAHDAAEKQLPAQPGRNVLELILVNLPQLRKSDRRVAEHILSDPQAALGATVAETARSAGVSEPTVMRFCAALGFEGFQDFKLKLAHSVALGVPATQSVLDVTDSPRALADKVFDYTMTSLDWARTQLDHDAVAKAIDILADAKRIEFFGFGASWIVAADAQQKFPLFGVPCLVHTDSHQQFMAASMMRSPFRIRVRRPVFLTSSRRPRMRVRPSSAYRAARGG
jgi:RpiR family carbohydrate utilization transcriptional regulator